jgi:sigma-B regulation protein RsbU (phosphoserine phosphatase)
LLEIVPATGAVKYVNAGHGDCVLLRNTGNAEKLEATGLPLGMMPPEMLEMLGKGYEERSLQIDTGDLLALYSDGVTEAYDEDENEWGDERLLLCLREVVANPSAQIVTKVFEEIDNFAQTAPQHDDITLLVIKRQE